MWWINVSSDRKIYSTKLGVRVMVFNATFNNISVISWGSVLLVEENGVLGENHQPPQVTGQLYHIMFQPNYATIYF